MNRDMCVVGNDCLNEGEGAQKGRRVNRGAEESNQPSNTGVSIITDHAGEAISALNYSLLIQVSSSLYAV